MSFKDYLNEEKGTYAGFKFDKESQDYIMDLIKELNVPNPVSRDDLHSTLLYSEKYLPDYKAAKNINGVAVADKLEIFKTDEGNVLVLRLDSEFMRKRHNELMRVHDATYPYPEYKPHVTLSYDVGDFKIPKVKLSKGIIIDKEYQEDLDKDWKDD